MGDIVISSRDAGYKNLTGFYATPLMPSMVGLSPTERFWFNYNQVETVCRDEW